ncbi:MAG: hypothetical protein QNJ94_21855 [Alphaproteobacteria bacterium]|nr:hypothetical protein [Alphaproteobacteria bacterium]
MTGSKKAQFIRPPNLLAAKVTISDEDLETRLKRANKLLRTMDQDYTEWVEQDLAALKQCLADVKGDPDDIQAHLKEFYRRTHDMKGQGELFGYPLITEVGESLCRFLRQIETPGPKELNVIEHHVDALTVVVLNRIQGDGGATGRELTLGLQTAVQKLIAAEPSS